MVIPEHLNYLEFYHACREQGVNVESRFEGVNVFLSCEKKPRWKVQFQRDYNYVYLGTFPFTKEGEEAAGKKYNDFLSAYKKLSSGEKKQKLKEFYAKYNSDKRKLYLHEAIVMVLSEKENKTATTEEIANEINKRGLYTRKDGQPLLPYQIRLRVKLSKRQYHHLFEFEEPDKVKLRNPG